MKTIAWKLLALAGYALCSLFDHPVAPTRKEMKVLRAMTRRLTIEHELKGQRVEVTVGCLCGRAMKPIYPWDPE